MGDKNYFYLIVENFMLSSVLFAAQTSRSTSTEEISLNISAYALT